MASRIVSLSREIAETFVRLRDDVTDLCFPGRTLKYIWSISERLTAVTRPVSTSRLPSSVPAGCSSTTLYVSVTSPSSWSSELVVSLASIDTTSSSNIVPLRQRNISNALVCSSCDGPTRSSTVFVIPQPDNFTQFLFAKNSSVRDIPSCFGVEQLSADCFPLHE